jgi:NAD-dependent histone deacetylase SIR2
MARMAIQAQPTKFHQLLRILDDRGILHRIYSQNIDGLEAKTGFDIFSQERSRRCILLHGSIATVQCLKCASSFMLENFLPLLQVGDLIDCPACINKGSEADASGKRTRAPGRLRPNILLFNEPSPIADEVADISAGDSNLIKNNHVLLVSGTSLKIPGIQSILNAFLKAMLNSQKVNCSLICVDNTAKMPSVLPKDTLYVQMDCQQFAELAISKIKAHFFTEDVPCVERRDFRPLWDWS